MIDQPLGAEAAKQVAKALVECGAVTFRTEPFFRFTSGVASPIYVDNRLLLGFPEHRRLVCDLLHTVATQDGGFEAVAGTATAGIPWAAWLAERLDLPLLYVRGDAKEWGHKKRVEGLAPRGSRTLLVEDLFYSAGSAVTSARHLRDEGYSVDRCLAIVTYGTEKAASRLNDLDVRASTLTDLATTVSVAAGSDLLDPAQVAVVLDWLDEISVGDR